MRLNSLGPHASCPPNPTPTRRRWATVWAGACLTVLAAGGCPAAAEQSGVDDGSSETDTDTDGDPTDGPSDTDTDGPSDTDTDGPSDTDTDGPGDTDTDGPGETDTDGPGGDPLCEEGGAAGGTLVVIDRTDWPDNPKGDFKSMVSIDAQCVVTALNPTPNGHTTVLECDDAGTPRDLEITAPAVVDPVAWAVGEVVDVTHNFGQLTAGYGTIENDISMRRTSDGALLLAAVDEDLGDLSGAVGASFAPLLVTADSGHCAPENSGVETWNAVLDFDNDVGATVALAHAQQGSLPPTAGEGQLEIRVGEARIGDDYCCHATGHIEALVRRTLAP